MADYAPPPEDQALELGPREPFYAALYLALALPGGLAAWFPTKVRAVVRWLSGGRRPAPVAEGADPIRGDPPRRTPSLLDLAQVTSASPSSPGSARSPLSCSAERTRPTPNRAAATTTRSGAATTAIGTFGTHPYSPWKQGISVCSSPVRLPRPESFATLDKATTCCTGCRNCSPFFLPRGATCHAEAKHSAREEYLRLAYSEAHWVWRSDRRPVG